MKCFTENIFSIEHVGTAKCDFDSNLLSNYKSSYETLEIT